MAVHSAESNNNLENQNQNDINQLLFSDETNNNNDDDVFWSMFSNAFFIGGGFFYIVGSTWDLSLSKSSSNEVDDGPQYNMTLYYLVWTLGPIVYLLNSAIDVTWAMRTMAIERKRRGMSETISRIYDE